MGISPLPGVQDVAGVQSYTLETAILNKVQLEHV